MEGAKLDEFIPLDLGWIAKSCKDWPSEDVGPILLVIFYLWPKGGRAPNDARKLAKVAGVSPRAWEGIRKTAGEFFRIDGDDLVQDFLVALYAKKAKVSLGNTGKAKKGAAARWEKERYRRDASSNAPSIASGNAPSIPSGNAWGYAKPMLRASSYSDLRISGEREETNATAMPNPVAAVVEDEITEALKAYPTTRKLPGGGTAEVRLGENARDLCRAFLACNPGYPLALAASYTAKRDAMPRDFENWIADPPAAARVLDAWDRLQRDRSSERARLAGLPAERPEIAPLRAMVEEITTHAERGLAHV